MRPLLLLILTALLFYLPVVNLGFVSDDHGLITNPSTGIASQSLLTIFGGDLWHFQESQSGYYRPLMMLSLMQFLLLSLTLTLEKQQSELRMQMLIQLYYLLLSLMLTKLKLMH